ncbi:MAG: glycosyltransferase family 4 protein [Myxococcaceae bacterium]
MHLHLHRRRTGVTRHVEDVVRALASSGACAWGWALGPTVPRTGLRGLWRAARAGALVLHAHRNLELLFALALRGLTPGVRVVWTRHGALPPSRWTSALAARADVRVTLSEEGRRTLGLPSVVVPHGVDVQAFRPPADRAAAWAALGLGGERGVAVVGRIRPAKGQGEAVAALARALPEAPGWRGVLVGEARGRDVAWLSSLLQVGGGRVLAVGQQEDMARWYQGATVVLQPSHTESFSLVLAEAMASGCCVVAARLPHYAALLEEGRSGFTYPPGDVSALLDVLRPLLREPETAARVGQAAAEAARTRFPLQREVAALQRLYQGAEG